jgi:ribosomal protein L16/L10AE
MGQGDATPQIMAVRQLKIGDVTLHAARAADTKTLKESAELWVKTLGTKARVVKQTYRVIAHGVCTTKDV